ncbi:arsenic transporter [Brachybacterium huguangmaarense]|uniref:Arsenical pump membrane protein n=1 Tax=Brachybacterium huguangmaarense TaxID=1652028 RepID=A0ABY6G4Y0_9MICO|nr:arsenic transporter [Brachybacterium huguangmaarense]
MLAATLVVVVWRPRGIGVGWPAVGGALLCLIVGLVHLADVREALSVVGDATIAFIAIVLISLVLDRAGLFSWAALHVARWGRGSPWRLFVLVILLGAATSVLFANDGAALILTPIVVGIVAELELSPAATLAYVMACGFIADTASLPLVISNLVNIITADFFDVSFTRYAAVMGPVGLVAIAASLGVLALFYRRSIPASYDVADLRSPAEAIADPLTFKAGFGVLALLLVGYVAADPLGIPLGAIASLGALALLVIAGIGRRTPVWSTVRSAPWHIIAFSVGMYVIVYALRNQGAADALGGVFAALGGYGLLVTALGVGLIVALLASVINNLPATLLAVLAIDAAGTSGAVRDVMMHAGVIGADLGPKFTPIGSLATLLWLHVLAGKGIRITWAQYLRTGLVLTAPVLVVTLAALAGWVALIGA